MTDITITALEELYAMRDILALDKAAQIKQVIPQEVQSDLEEIQAEFGIKEETLAERIATYEAFLKNQAIEARQTIHGGNFNVQFTKGGQTVTAKDVLKLADRWEKTNPDVASELRGIITYKKDSACIK